MAAAQISLEYLATSRAWIEGAVIVACLALAWLLSHPMRKRLPTDLPRGAMKIGAGSIHRVAFPVLAWILVWAGRLVLQRWQPVPLLGIAIPLLGSFAAIRLAVYLLRHSIAASGALKALERFIAYGVWALFALYLTGILPEIRAELDSLSLNASGRKITVLQVLEGLFWTTLAVFAALSASRLIEERALAKVDLEVSLRVFLAKFIRAVAIALGILIALPMVGIDLTVLSVFGGALGVGLGLGLQKVASNYVSGLVILLERAIRPGDQITVADRQGVVVDIKSRYTLLRNPDGSEAIIPNDTITTNTVLNHGANRAIAIKATVTTSHSSSLDHALAQLRRVGTAQADILGNPEPVAQVTRVHPGGVDLELTVWIASAGGRDTAMRSAMLQDIVKAFRGAGVEFAPGDAPGVSRGPLSSTATPRPESQDPPPGNP